MYDDLMEKDPKMKRIRAESNAEGEARGLRRSVITVTEARFPSLVELASQKVTSMTKVDELNTLLKQVSTASDESTARLLFAMQVA